MCGCINFCTPLYNCSVLDEGALLRLLDERVCKVSVCVCVSVFKDSDPPERTAAETEAGGGESPRGPGSGNRIVNVYHQN